MKNNQLSFMSFLVGLLLIMITFTFTSCFNTSNRKQLQIAVIPKGTTHDFFKTVYAGAKKASKELDVKIYWNGPIREGDRNAQISIIEDFITKGVDGIALSPLDDTALVPVVERIYKMKIPCIIFDSGINTTKYNSFIATDNYEGGKIAALRMAEILNGKGNILVMKYNPGSSSTTKREHAFVDEIEKNYPEIKILETKYGLDTVETALQAVEDLLTRYKDVQGIFACNEPTSVGTLRAVASQKRKEIQIVGFDASVPLINALKEGKIDSLVVQNPFNMGYLSVRSVVKAIKGESVEKKINTQVKLVTKDNIATKEVEELLGI